MAHIVYLIGAGASRGTRSPKPISSGYELLKSNGIERYGYSCADITTGLPIVNEIPDRISHLISCLAAKKNELDKLGDGNQVLESLISDVEWMRDNSKKHASIDTFAKKLYLIGNKDDYIRLKKALIIYLTYEQYKKPDERYDSFFASILGKDKHDLPSNVSILSWNYDCQIEMAYGEYLRSDNIKSASYFLNEVSKFADLREESPYEEKDGFKIIKLNGTAIIDNGDYFEKNKQDDIAQSLMELYKRITFGNMRLSFAWEKMDSRFQTLISNSFTDTDVIVIIGYSFPFFNREVDRLIFNSMTNLKKIYIQDPNAEKIKIGLKSVIQERSSVLQQIEILEPDEKQFFLPPEL